MPKVGAEYWKSLIGRKVNNGFGDLEILDYEKIPSKQTKVILTVRCVCGNVYKSDMYLLIGRHPTHKSCGCDRAKWKYASKEELRAMMPIHTRLTPINFSHMTEGGREGHDKRYYWNFLCDCGKSKPILINSVFIKSNPKHTQLSCGCLKKDSAQKRVTDGTHHQFGVRVSKEEGNQRLEAIGSCIRIIEVGSPISRFYCQNCKTEFTGDQHHFFRRANRYCLNCAPALIKHRKRKKLGVWPRCKTRSSRNLKKGQHYCSFCATTVGNFVTHHITMRHLLVDRFFAKVQNTFNFENEVINHPRNLIRLCENCHSLAHPINSHSIDRTMTHILKAINRFSF